MNPKCKILFAVLLFPALGFSQKLNFNQLVGVLQKINNNTSTILNTIDKDLKVNGAMWVMDGPPDIKMDDVKYGAFNCEWFIKKGDQELYRLGVLKFPIQTADLQTSLSYWFPYREIYNNIKVRAIEFGAVEVGKTIDEEGIISFLYRSKDYDLILKETPPEHSDLVINGQKQVRYQAILSFRRAQ